MASDFFNGMGYAGRGIGDFFSRPELWKYAVFPVLIVFALYTGAGFAAFCCIDNIFASIGVFILVLLSLTLLCPLYELFGGIFFDSMVEAFEKKEYDNRNPGRKLFTEITFFLEACLFSFVTLLLFLLMFLIGLIPVIGPVLLVLVMGYRYALTYMLNVCCCHGLSVKDLKKAAAKKRMAVAGFGTAVYFLLLIPLGGLFFLPGIILGASRLYNEKLR